MMLRLFTVGLIGIAIRFFRASATVEPGIFEQPASSFVFIKNYGGIT